MTSPTTMPYLLRSCQLTGASRLVPGRLADAATYGQRTGPAVHSTGRRAQLLPLCGASANGQTGPAATTSADMELEELARPGCSSRWNRTDPATCPLSRDVSQEDHPPLSRPCPHSPRAPGVRHRRSKYMRSPVRGDRRNADLAVGSRITFPAPRA